MKARDFLKKTLLSYLLIILNFHFTRPLTQWYVYLFCKWLSFVLLQIYCQIDRMVINEKQKQFLVNSTHEKGRRCFSWVSVPHSAWKSMENINLCTAHLWMKKYWNAIFHSCSRVVLILHSWEASGLESSR